MTDLERMKAEFYTKGGKVTKIAPETKGYNDEQFDQMQINRRLFENGFVYEANRRIGKYR